MENSLVRNYFKSKIDIKISLTILLLFASLFKVHATNPNNAFQSISLKMENESIVDIFNEIEKRTDYNILYKDSTLDLNKKMTINVVEVEIDALMDLLLKESNLLFEIRRKIYRSF